MGKRNNGITLIALVVTIIILLILAGVSINMLTGQNGIINRAAEAKQSTGSSNDLEYLQLKATEALTDYYQGNDTMSEDDYVLKKWAADSNSKIRVNQGEKTFTYNNKTYNIADIIGNQSEKTKVEQNNMKQITVSNVTDEEDKKILSSGKVRLIIEENDTTMKAAVPNGFYYVTGTPSTGLVISDKYGDDDNNSRGGNQFVWVPCSGDKGVTYQKEVGLATTWQGKYKGKSWWYNSYTTGQKDDKGNDVYANVAAGTWSDDGGDLDSVKTYGGFYIARYEAGVPENATSFYANANNSNYSRSRNPSAAQIITDDEIKNGLTEAQVQKKLLPVSKKNNPSWNFISQENAVKVSKAMYYNNGAVTSSLVDSYAWDTVVEWMTTRIDITKEEQDADPKKKEEAKILGNLGFDSTSKGNYYDNYKIDLENVLYALHRYDSSKKKPTVGDAWSYATKYKKGKLTTGAITNINEIKEYKDLTNHSIDTDTYNYSIRKEIATGSAKETKVKNIYDMAGNMWEWTTETGKPDGGSTLRAVLRGGSFGNSGSNNTVAYRDGYNAAVWGSVSFGFRVVLYIQ